MLDLNPYESLIFSQSPDTHSAKSQKTGRQHNPLFCSVTSYGTVAQSLQERVLEKSHGEIVPMKMNSQKGRVDRNLQQQQQLCTQQDTESRLNAFHPIYHNQQLEKTNDGDAEDLSNKEVKQFSKNKEFCIESNEHKNRFQSIPKERQMVSLKKRNDVTAHDSDSLSRQQSSQATSQSLIFNNSTSFPVGSIKISKETQLRLHQHKNIERLELSQQQEQQYKQQEDQELSLKEFERKAIRIPEIPSRQPQNQSESEQKQIYSQDLEKRIQEFFDQDNNEFTQTNSIQPSDNNNSLNQLKMSQQNQKNLKKPQLLPNSNSTFYNNSPSITPSQCNTIAHNAIKQSLSFPMEQQEFLKYEKQHGNSHQIESNSSVKEKTKSNAIFSQEEDKNNTRELTYHLQEQYALREKYEGASSKSHGCNCTDNGNSSCKHSENKEKKKKVKDNLQMYHNEAFQFLMSMNTNLAHFKENEQRRKGNQDNVVQHSKSSSSIRSRNILTEQQIPSRNIINSNVQSSEKNQIVESKECRKDNQILKISSNRLLSSSSSLSLTQRDEKNTVSNSINHKQTINNKPNSSIAKTNLYEITNHSAKLTHINNNNSKNKGFMSPSLLQNSIRFNSRSPAKDMPTGFSFASPISKMYPLPCSMPTNLSSLQNSSPKITKPIQNQTATTPVYLKKTKILKEKEHTVQSIMASTFCQSLSYSMHRDCLSIKSVNASKIS